MSASLTFGAVGLLFLVVLFAVLRQGRMREKYAGLWIVVGVTGAVLGIWPTLLQGLTSFLGFQVPSNLLFFLAILLLLGVCLHLSLEVSQLEDETRTLAEEIAILNEHLDRLSARIEKIDPGTQD